MFSQIHRFGAFVHGFRRNRWKQEFQELGERIKVAETDMALFSRDHPLFRRARTYRKQLLPRYRELKCNLGETIH